MTIWLRWKSPVPLQHRQMMKTKILKILILTAAVLVCGCDKNNLPQPTKENMENAKMDNTEMDLYQIMKQCQTTDPQSLDSLLQKCNDPGFLSQLDKPAVYEDDLDPPTLLKVLQCLAENPNQPAVTAGLGKLADSPLYARSDAKGTLRRNVLIVASGNLTQPNKKILAFLENEVVIDGEKRAAAVHALSKIGVPESLAVLSKHIFQPQTCVIPENLREIYLPNFTMEMGKFRDRQAVLSLLLDQLYQTELRSEVLLCLTKDRIERSPEHKFHIMTAPLNEKTANSAALAKKIAVWLIQNAPDLKEDEFAPITKRVPDLLGVKDAQLPAQEGSAIKQWAKKLFQEALKQSDDSERKQQLQLQLNNL